MGISLDKLKKNRNKRLEELSKELEDSKKGYHNPDEDKYWKLKVDESGNGYAILRFLDDPEMEQSPYRKMYTHGFQGPKGKWYIENSLTTIGKEDPVSEMNTELWNSGIEANKELVSKHRKRRLQYVSNVYVVHDPKNPENEGKVFMFSYGPKIREMIDDKVNPKFEDEERLNPFDFFEGANFHLKAFNKDTGYRSYDKSTFGQPGPLTDKEGNVLDDETVEEILNSWHDLSKLHDESNFKPYDVLKKKLYQVLEMDDSGNSDDGDVYDDKPKEEAEPKKEKETAPKKEKEVERKEEKKEEKKADVTTDDGEEIDFDDIFGDI